MLASALSHGALNDYVVKQWSEKDGLASQSVQSIAQDSLGYLWLGTKQGLSRFDGNSFATFNTSNSKFLLTNSINKLLLSRDGFLWIGSAKGLTRFNPLDFSFTHYNVRGEVKDLQEDEQGRLWIAANGLFIFSNNQLNSVSQLLADSGRIIGDVVKIATSPQGVWLINQHSLLRLSSSTNSVGGLRLELTAQVSLPQRLARTIIYDMVWLETDLYLGSEIGPYFLDIDEELRPLAIPFTSNSPVYAFLSNERGELWVSVNGRLLMRDISARWHWIEPVDIDQTLWFGDIYRDRENNIWLASFSEGLWQAKPGLVDRHDKLSDLDSMIFALESDYTGRIWVAQEQGLGFLDTAGKFQLAAPMSALKGNRVNDIFAINQRVYIATNKGAQYYEDGKIHDLDIPILRNSAVFSITQSAQGGLWFATDRGLYRLAFNGLRSFVYNRFLDSKVVTFFLEQKNSGMLGTRRGAYRYDEQGIKHLGIGTALETANVSSIVSISESLSFIGTLNHGLFYQASNGDWLGVDGTQGLPYGPILSLHYDSNLRRLWVSTTKGIYHLPVAQFETDKEIKTVRVERVVTPYDKLLDGRSGQCCTGSGASGVVEDTTSLWYPSKLGLVEVKKDYTSELETQLTPIVEAIKTDNKHYPSFAKNVVELASDERHLRIQYSAIDFNDATELNFRYRLTGFDKNWSREDDNREAVYTNLAAGNYTFEVAVKRPGQEWQDAPSTKLTIAIPMRFDETVYFRLIVVGSFILAIYLFFIVYRGQARKKQGELERLVDSRTHALTLANEQLNQVNERLKLVSHSDELTGLRSRRFVFEQIPKDVEHYQGNRASLESQGKSLCMLILNIDNFSRINDTYGSFAGDSCLQQFAALLNEQVSGSDYVVRWSGDEYLILLRDILRDEQAKFAIALANIIAAHDFALPDGRKIKLAASIGWAPYPLPLLGGQIVSWETSIKLADMALQQVKKHHAGKVAYFSFKTSLDAFELEDSEGLEEQVEQLLKAGSLVLESN
jgi:diguanylate cyclase (GGDEF)-like protein